MEYFEVIDDYLEGAEVGDVVGVDFLFHRLLLSGLVGLRRLDYRDCFGPSLLGVLVYLVLCGWLLPDLGSLEGI